LYWAGHGRIRFRPDVERLDGDGVRFVDGSRERIDLIVYATGYKLSFPFLDGEHLAWQDGRPRLFLNCFHPTRDDLFVAGLIQPDSGIWGLADLQAQLIAGYVNAFDQQRPAAEWFRRLKSRVGDDLDGGIRYVDSPRHGIEVEYYGYRRRLEGLIARIER
jgi:hypothetical protein